MMTQNDFINALKAAIVNILFEKKLITSIERDRIKEKQLDKS